MVLNFVLFYIPFILLSLFIDSSIREVKNKKILYFFACIYILSFSWSLIEKSGDYKHYRDSFNNIESWTDYLVGTALKGYEFEPGFVSLNLTIKNFLTIDAFYGIGIITLLAGGGLLYQMFKYSRYSFIVLVVYLAHFYWWSGIVLLRQMCALVVLFPIIRFLAENKIKQTICLILLASLFHSSALIFLFFLFARRLNLLKFNKLYIIIAFLIGYLDIFKTIVIIVSFIIPRGDVFVKYLGDESRLMNPMGILEMFLIMYIALKYRNKLSLDNKFYNTALDLLSFSILLTLCLMRYEIGFRFNQYFNLFSFVILIPSFIDIFKKNIANRLSYIFILSCYMTIYLVRFVYITV